MFRILAAGSDAHRAPLPGQLLSVSPSETIFCRRDGSPILSFKKSFAQALQKAGVLHGSDGKKRTPYSLRHTYATMRLSEGVSVFQLAANMGTSVEMLDDFYGKKRVRDPKMATELTKVA
jgi:integrase